MNHGVKRIYVEKKPGMDVEAKALLQDFRENLGISGLTNVRVVNRYDAEGISQEEYEAAKFLIFAEPNADNVYDEVYRQPEGAWLFAQESLPGQYDQRADSAAQCIQILTQKERPSIRTAKLYVLEGSLTAQELDKIKSYTINPVESREASLEKPLTLEWELDSPADVPVLSGFREQSDEEIARFRAEMGLAMSDEDLAFCRDYFRDQEQRDPTVTEIRVIDTYWSDHCRHTTFLTRLNDIRFGDSLLDHQIRKTYEMYLAARSEVYGERQKDITLMDIATMGMKYLKKTGRLQNLDESEEINACSIRVKAKIDGQEEDWLVMFKNETHNHPTEIEPFGGAATCLGGAIRDPLSGRSYVYQAMRVTGSADPTVPVSDTLEGKLPQRKITTGAAAGYSSYGNQIGLATGQVQELYHPGYVAKRMEIGAVIAAAPAENVVRKQPEKGDVIILLGGRTGRDGIGGATGSSKEHTLESVKTCGSEVQKGNPPTERKLQRLLRKPEVSRLIKRCNDFGAGGVCVAIGELAPALEIYLDRVPKKYEGLDGTELAISESQERMAVVVSAGSAPQFVAYAREENLEAVPVAVVTDTGRLQMVWRNQTIVNISRAFLDTNGVKQDARVLVKQSGAVSFIRPERKEETGSSLAERWKRMLSDLNSCSQKGLAERFDSTIGAGTILMPFGGRFQWTPAEGMAAKLPVLTGETETATLMAYGFDPFLAESSPYHGAIFAVVESLAKITAMGGDAAEATLTFQEYFERLGQDPQKWGKPFSALLGAFYAQMECGVAAIGGKDSMSGTFLDLHVPPTLVSFAVVPVAADQVVSSEWKQAGHLVAYYRLPLDAAGLPDFGHMKKNYKKITKLMREGKIVSAMTVKSGGLAETLSKMAFGNKIGFALRNESVDLFEKRYGSIVLELSDLCSEADLEELDCCLLGETLPEPWIQVGDVTLDLEELLSIWRKPLQKIFPDCGNALSGQAETPLYDAPAAMRKARAKVRIARPRVFLPVFPGTNCEYDTARAFEKAGAVAEPLVFRNLTGKEIEDSLNAMVRQIRNAQIIMIPGGFSGGDEPDGSGKFIATAFRNPAVKEAVMELLQKRDGLILGICNGFQALIKLGLVPYGEIRDLRPEDPTLTFNTVGRHISRMVNTRVVSNLSPWLRYASAGEIHRIPISHGEGRFLASSACLAELEAKHQIATQYVDDSGAPTMDSFWNPNGSIMAIEGITSPDGRVLGKMGHSERVGTFVCRNVPGEKDQRIIASGVGYYTE